MVLLMVETSEYLRQGPGKTAHAVEVVEVVVIKGVVIKAVDLKKDGKKI